MSSQEPSKEEVKQLMKAAEDGDIATLKDLIVEKHINVDTRDPGYPRLRRTPLMISASKGRSTAVDYLLELGADIHAVDTGGTTVLHHAAEGGSVSLIERFLNAGVNVNVFDYRGNTPLHEASAGNSAAAIEVLIKNGAAINQTNKYGVTPLHEASAYDSAAAIEVLIKNGAAINQTNDNGNTPLHYASWRNSAAAIEVLIKNGATINQTNDGGDTPLHYASRRNSAAAIEVLLKNGAAINQTNNSDRTPLEEAVYHDNSAAVWTLINNHNVDISQYDEDTKQEISDLLAREEEERKTQQDVLSSSSEEETDQSVDTTQADLSHEDVNKALLDSTLPSPDVRVAMIGTEGSGKTCLGDTLTGQEFKDTSPTEGADEMEIIVKNSVDWSVLTKDEMIENLQQQMLQEAKHCATEQLESTPEDTTAPTSAPEDTTTSTTKPVPEASSSPSHLSKAKPDPPTLPMLNLPSGDKMYILTLEEFKQLPSIVEKYDALRRYVNIWDYAGQHVFQHTHGLFVSEEVVCLIVFDASKLLDEVPERRYESDKSPARSGLDTITYWMDLISCRVSKKSTSDSDLSEFLPTFVLVGTKIDLLSSDVKEAEEIALQRFVPIFKEKLATKPFAKHIAGSKKGQLFTQESSSIFFLSNRTRNSEVVAKLQQVVLQAAPKKSRPTRLVKMERKLMLLSHKEKLSVANMVQVKEVARSCGISPDDKEILEVLKFFHQKGTLLYFHQVPALSNVIILCPQWLAKLLTYVLTNLICQPAGPPLAHYAEERNKKGFLRQELINFCIDKFLTEENRKGRKVPKLVGDDVVDLLLKFKLMVDVTDTSLGAKKIASPKNRIFLVPHLLPVQEFVPATGPCYKIFYFFPGLFIPDNLVDQLIVKCAEWNKSHKFGFLRLAYQWVSMKLGGHQSYQLRPIHKSDLIELTIASSPMMPQEEETTALNNSNELITAVKLFIDDLMQESMTATFEQYPVECYLPCPSCSEVHVELEEIKDNSSDFCPTTNEFIDMIRYHKMLTCEPSSEGSVLFSEMLKQEPKMKHLINMVVPKVAAHWNDVAFNLDFSISTVQIIAKKFLNDPVSCCKELFEQWLNSSEGTQPKIWSTLLMSLKQIRHLRAATEEIEKELKCIPNM